MQLRQRIAQVQKLKLKLSPRLIQQMRLSQRSYSDLMKEIAQESSENVFIEVIQDDRLLSSMGKSTGNRLDSTSEDDDFIDRLADYSEFKSLDSFLLNQLEHLSLDPIEKKIAMEMLGYLDERGYFRDYQSLCLYIVKTFSVSERKVNELLKLIQSLEPEGVGARNLKECLLIQLEAQAFESEELKSLFETVISKHLDELDDHEALAKKLKLSEEAIDAVLQFIRHNLNPNPGASFQRVDVPILVPSFEVRVGDEGLSWVNLEKKMGVRVAISSQYKSLLDDPNTDEESKIFLKEKLRKAEEWMDMLAYRERMLETLMSFLLQRQAAFFKNGIHYLEPLLQREIAEKVGLSASSISRLVSNKAIRTPQGLFLLKSLCPRSYFGKTSERFKALLRKVFDTYPNLSDQKISELLKKSGLNIARRTVNKYRHLTEKISL